MILQIGVNFKPIVRCYWSVSLVGKDQLWREWIGINVYKLLRSSNLFSQERGGFCWWRRSWERLIPQNRKIATVYRFSKKMETTKPKSLEKDVLRPIAIDVSNKMSQSKLEANISRQWVTSAGKHERLVKTVQDFLTNQSHEVLIEYE